MLLEKNEGTTTFKEDEDGRTDDVDTRTGSKCIQLNKRCCKIKNA